MLRIDRLYFDDEDDPVELAVSYFDPEHYSYRVKLPPPVALVRRPARAPASRSVADAPGDRGWQVIQSQVGALDQEH